MGLPSTLVAYKKTEEYDHDTMPKALMSSHTTKPGVWAVIRVLKGRLKYRTLGDGGSEIVLTPQIPGFVEPETEHEIEPDGDVRFYIEFFRDPGDDG